MTVRRRSLMRLTLLLSLVGAMLVVAAPAAADNSPKVPTGTRINLFVPPTTFVANTPFYVAQGTGCPLGTGIVGSCDVGGWTFSLYVDGVLQPSAVVVWIVDGTLERYWLTNFPGGLPAGEHTLFGVWTQGSSYVFTRSVTITFT
jgi:hypothetical protein